jgi:hypothetical protein
MKPLRTALKLPRYCRRKPLKNGSWAYFFEPPTWARAQGCPLEAEALGQNYDAAVTRAENILLPAFDSWRTRGLSESREAVLIGWPRSLRSSKNGKMSTRIPNALMNKAQSFSRITS